MKVLAVLLLAVSALYAQDDCKFIRNTHTLKAHVLSAAFVVSWPPSYRVAEGDTGLQSTFGSTGSMVFSCFGNGVHPRCIDNGRVEGENRLAAIV